MIERSVPTTEPSGLWAIWYTLDAEGNAIGRTSVQIPQSVEAAGGAAIDAYIAAQLAPPAPQQEPTA